MEKTALGKSSLTCFIWYHHRKLGTKQSVLRWPCGRRMWKLTTDGKCLCKISPQKAQCPNNFVLGSNLIHAWAVRVREGKWRTVLQSIHSGLSFKKWPSRRYLVPRFMLVGNGNAFQWGMIYPKTSLFFIILGCKVTIFIRIF